MTKIYCPELYTKRLPKYRSQILDEMFKVYVAKNKGIDEDVIAMSLADKLGWTESKVKMYLRKLGLRKFTGHLHRTERF